VQSVAKKFPLRRLLVPIAAAWGLAVASLILFADPTPPGAVVAAPAASITGPATSVPAAPAPASASLAPAPSLIDQSHAAAARKSAGCIECHANIEDMHASPHVVLGCI